MKFRLATLLLVITTSAFAQQRTVSIPVGVRFVATEANAPPGSCGCFFLTGAAVDTVIPLAHNVSAAVDLAGTTTSNVPGTTRGLSLITLLAGPRYTVPIHHRASLHAQALFGVARGFDADLILTSQQHTDTASVFAMALGGALDIPVTHTIDIRAAQIDYQQSNLPNGSDNRQRNIRFGAGLVFHVKLPTSRSTR